MLEISAYIFILFFFNINTLKSEIKNNNIISLKFKIYYPYTEYGYLLFNIDDYLDKIHLSKLYLEVGVGNESDFETNVNQTLNIIVDLNEIIFSSTNLYFSKYTVENNNILCNYNTSESSTFYESDTYYNIYGFKTLCSYAKEYFQIYTDTYLSKYNITKLNFLNTINHKTSKVCGNIGLTYLHQESRSYNFIAQLHTIFNLSDFSIIFNYSSNNPDEGIFIFGNMPHVYAPDKYNIDNVISIYSKSMKEPLIDFIKFDLDGKKIEKKDENIQIKIDPDIEGIEFPEYYFKFFEDSFFQKYYNNNICHSEHGSTKRVYRIIQCDGGEGENKFGNEIIKSFPKLIFDIDMNNNFSISFNGEDLFYFKDNKYFFKIAEKALENNFVLGRMLFKKYITILNPDKRQIYFYNIINSDESGNDNNDDDTKTDSNNGLNIETKILIIIICFACLLIFFPLGVYFGKIIFKKRKKVAYELSDGYDYSPAQDGNEVINDNQ